jgi:hypothetical protein
MASRVPTSVRTAPQLENEPPRPVTPQKIVVQVLDLGGATTVTDPEFRMSH